jgi:hypothetical protein
LPLFLAPLPRSSSSLAQILFLIVLMATIAGRDHGAATEDSLSLTAKLRARMRTKSFVELAPGLRALLLASLAFVALPSLAFFVLTLVSGDEEVKYKMYVRRTNERTSEAKRSEEARANVARMGDSR